MSSRDTNTQTTFCYFPQAISEDTGFEMEQARYRLVTTMENDTSGSGFASCATSQPYFGCFLNT